MPDICKNYHGGADTSVEANERVEPAKRTQRGRVLWAIRHAVEMLQAGWTCEELEYHCDLAHTTCSARISELKRDGLIKVVGKRKTRSGCNARVYVAT